MEFVFTVFDHVADGAAGRRWARHAASLVAVVAIGIMLKLDAAEWVFDRYIEYKTAVAQDLLEDVVNRLEVPPTTVPRSGVE